MADNFRWKSVSVISGRVGFHLPSLLGFLQLDNTARTDGLKLSLKLYPARELRLGYQQSIAEAPSGAEQRQNRRKECVGNRGWGESSKDGQLPIYQPNRNSREPQPDTRAI